MDFYLVERRAPTGTNLAHPVRHAPQPLLQRSLPAPTKHTVQRAVIAVGDLDFVPLRQMHHGVVRHIHGAGDCLCELTYGTRRVRSDVEHAAVRTIDRYRAHDGINDVTHVAERSFLLAVAEDGHRFGLQNLIHEDPDDVAVAIADVLELAIHVMGSEDHVIETEHLACARKIEFYGILCHTVRIFRSRHHVFSKRYLPGSVHCDRTSKHETFAVGQHRFIDEVDASYQVVLVVETADVVTEPLCRVSGEMIDVLEPVSGKQLMYRSSIENACLDEGDRLGEVFAESARQIVYRYHIVLATLDESVSDVCTYETGRSGYKYTTHETVLVPFIIAIGYYTYATVWRDLSRQGEWSRRGRLWIIGGALAAMRCMVTGSNGFIGYHTCRRLVECGVEVIGVDDLSAGTAASDVAGVTYHRNTIMDAGWLLQLIRDARPDVIVHLAAVPRVAYSVQQPLRSALPNVVGTIAVLDGLLQAGLTGTTRLVFASSSSVYGGATVMPTPETHPCDPQSPYALAKLNGEQWCRMFHRLYGLDVVSLRYFNVFGPRALFGGAYSTVLCAWFYHLFVDASYRPRLEGDGSQSRDFCYVDNVAEANVAAATRERGFTADVFNVAQGSAHSLLEVKDAVERIAGRRLDLERRPPRRGDVRHTLADITRAQVELNYHPTSDFHAQLAQTAAWYRDSYPRP